MANEVKKKKPNTTKKTTSTKSKIVQKKTGSSTVKKPSTATKKPTSKPKTATAKKPTVKPKTTAAKKTSTAVKKPVQKKSTTVSKPKTVTKSVATKKVPKKPTTNKVKSSVKPKVIQAKTTAPIKSKKPKQKAKETVPKKTPSTAVVKKEPKKVIVTQSQLKKEAVKVMDVGTQIAEQKKKGKLFYLVFALLFYAVAFFYINNILYDNNDYIESALFAFAALFVAFVIIEFNIHMLFINFFRLPFKYLIDQSRVEIKKGKRKKGKGVKSTFSRYRAMFTLSLYIIIILGLVGLQVYNGILDEDKVSVIFTQSFSTVVVFLIIVCSWQYLFNILPSVLDKSIDAKNGFILTLSAAGMILFIVFYMFDITYLSELMIFVLMVGFIALLGVNLNMIVGEINIFQNIKSKKNKAVTRAVFLIFFSFHIYVILYASVVAFSIYRWEPEAFNFSGDDCYTENIYFDDEGIQQFDVSYACEHGYGDFLYYTVVSVSTLGYGDITPSLDYSISQAWGAFLSFYGFTFFALSIGLVSNIAIEGITSREDELDD